MLQHDRWTMETCWKVRQKGLGSTWVHSYKKSPVNKSIKTDHRLVSGCLGLGSGGGDSDCWLVSEPQRASCLHSLSPVLGYQVHTKTPCCASKSWPHTSLKQPRPQASRELRLAKTLGSFCILSVSREKTWLKKSFFSFLIEIAF